MIDAEIVGSGQPIVLIHGFCKHRGVWEQLVSHLSQRFHVIALDLPGFGRSIPLPDSCQSIDEVAHLIAGFLYTRNISNAYVAGHSLGGYVALAMADLHTPLVKGLLLVNSTSFGDSPEKKRVREKVIQFISRRGVGPFIDQFVGDLFYDQHLTPNVEKVRAMGADCTSDTLVSYTRFMRDRQDRTFLLSRPGLPALVIAGEHDQLIPVADSQAMIDRLPPGHGAVLEACGHMAMYEQPDLLHQHISTFIQRYSTNPT